MDQGEFVTPSLSHVIWWNRQYKVYWSIFDQYTKNVTAGNRTCNKDCLGGIDLSRGGFPPSNYPEICPSAEFVEFTEPLKLILWEPSLDHMKLLCSNLQLSTSKWQSPQSTRSISLFHKSLGKCVHFVTQSVVLVILMKFWCFSSIEVIFLT